MTLVSLTTTTSPSRQQLGQLSHRPMPRWGGAAVDEQAGGVARLDRHLGDARRRQVVVELLEAHDARVRIATCATICRVTTQRDDAVTIDGSDMTMTTWLPDAGSGPGLLLIQEIFGVGPYIRAVGARLAEAGYVVAAPDLFWRFAPGFASAHDEPGLAASMQQAANLDPARAVSDSIAALDQLDGFTGVTGRPGVIGFCLGGTIAFGVAADSDPAVCISYYGSGVPGMLDRLDDVTCPTLFHFGTRDPYIPGDGVDALGAALDRRPGFVLNVEDAGHAFDNHEAPMFHDEAAARAAWSKTTAFLAEHLPVD